MDEESEMSDETQPLEDREGIDWSPDQGSVPDRGRHAGHALTEVRTVLSRAQTALQRLEDHGPLEYPPLTGNPVLDGYRTRSDGRFDDPDLEDMIQILKITVGMLKRWERTGKATRSTCL
jgi:hypothetical protein